MKITNLRLLPKNDKLYDGWRRRNAREVTAVAGGRSGKGGETQPLSLCNTEQIKDIKKPKSLYFQHFLFKKMCMHKKLHILSPLRLYSEVG